MFVYYSPFFCFRVITVLQGFGPHVYYCPFFASESSLFVKTGQDLQLQLQLRSMSESDRRGDSGPGAAKRTWSSSTDSEPGSMMSLERPYRAARRMTEDHALALHLQKRWNAGLPISGSYVVPPPTGVLGEGRVPTRPPQARTEIPQLSDIPPTRSQQHVSSPGSSSSWNADPTEVIGEGRVATRPQQARIQLYDLPPARSALPEILSAPIYPDTKSPHMTCADGTTR